MMDQPSAMLSLDHLRIHMGEVFERILGIYDELGVSTQDIRLREQSALQNLHKALDAQLTQALHEKRDACDELQRIEDDINRIDLAFGQNMHPRNQQYGRGEQRSLLHAINHAQEVLRARALAYYESFDQVENLQRTLDLYASYLKPCSSQSKKSPSSENTRATFSADVSTARIHDLDSQIAAAKAALEEQTDNGRKAAEEIMQLCAEMGMSSSLHEPSIMQCFQLGPEKLGIRQSELHQLLTILTNLRRQKAERDRKIRLMMDEIEILWEKLEISESVRNDLRYASERRSMQSLCDLENELHRLQRLKRDNLSIFIEDTRCTLQELWDDLMLSEDEMLAFTPAFSDECNDDLLDAHEHEISRLSSLKEQRGPLLDMVRRHQALLKDRDDLAQSSQDASRLLMKAAKGEKRDPTRLLREEKLRKRVHKELPKLEAQILREIMAWEKQHGLEFLVRGESYQSKLINKSQSLCRSKSVTRPDSKLTNPPKRPQSAPKLSASSAERPVIGTPARRVVTKQQDKSCMALNSATRAGHKLIPANSRQPNAQDPRLQQGLNHRRIPQKKGANFLAQKAAESHCNHAHVTGRLENSTSMQDQEPLKTTQIWSSSVNSSLSGLEQDDYPDEHMSYLATNYQAHNYGTSLMRDTNSKIEGPRYANLSTSSNGSCSAMSLPAIYPDLWNEADCDARKLHSRGFPLDLKYANAATAAAPVVNANWTLHNDSNDETTSHRLQFR